MDLGFKNPPLELFYPLAWSGAGRIRGSEIHIVVFCIAGAKGPVFTAQLGYKSDRQSEFQPKDLMAGEKEISGINRNPYPPIEPYSTGFLKVSDLHTIYWEQSGNPTGHVSIFYHPNMFKMSPNLENNCLLGSYFSSEVSANRF